MHVTKSFDLNNDDILWEKFMCFMREIIPYEESQLSELSETQKTAVIAFLYCAEVMGEGHIGFFDLYGEYISYSTVMVALKELCVSDRYIKIIEELSKDFIPVSEMRDKCISEEGFMDEIYAEFDDLFYQYGDKEIINKIIYYVRKHHMEFFKYT
ncbi:MAG: DMP19 family protein [Lachnospiraceae bacterium]|nr:DMP19 family protein [Lachnospiraceae bacterium]